MGKKTSNDAIVTSATQMVNAIGKYMGPKDELFVGGEHLKTGALSAIFQTALSTRHDAVAAHGSYKEALVAREAAESKRLVATDALKSYVLNRFGTDSAVAHDFGFAPKKVGEKSVATKAKAIALNEATRKARGTMGKRERLQIKGTLPETAVAQGAAVSPVVLPVAAAPVAAVPAVSAVGNVAGNGAVHG
jgi:hypothetical protein